MRMVLKTKGANNLASWREVMRTAPAMIGQLGEEAAHELLDLTLEGFRTSKNPYGEPWQQKKVDDGRRVLIGKTLQLRKWSVVKKGNGRWSIQPSPTAGDYAGAHQDPRPRARWGGKSLPQRMMIPSKARGLPPKWREQIEESIADSIHALAGGSTGGAGIGMIGYKIIGLKRRFSLPAILKRAARELADG